MTLHPVQAAELIFHMEACALEAEAKGGLSGSVDAECIRRQSPGLIEAIEKVEEQAPGYAAECIRAMSREI